MATFEERIEDYVGAISDTTFLSDVLTAGAKEIVNLLPERKLRDYTVDLTDPGTGVAITGHRFLSANVSGRGTTEISSNLKAAVIDADSIHYATVKYPVHYFENGEVFIKPSGGTAVAMAYPTVLYSASTITNFPTDLIQAVVLYGAIQAALRLENEALTTLIDESDIELRQAETERQAVIAKKYADIAASLKKEYEELLRAA